MGLHLDYAALEREARAESRPGLVRIAHEIAALATATSPVETGLFGSGFEVETGGYPAVSNFTEGAFYIEYGTSDTPAHGTLTSAAKQFGRYHGYEPYGPEARA